MRGNLFGRKKVPPHPLQKTFGKDMAIVSAVLFCGSRAVLYGRDLESSVRTIKTPPQPVCQILLLFDQSCALLMHFSITT